jgi:hypothetical protein
MEKNVIRISIDGRDVVPGPAWALRWVDRESGGAAPVLYRDGKRVTRQWRLEAMIDQAVDAHAGNANTD